MAGIMAVAAIVAILGLRRGVQEDPAAAEAPVVAEDATGTADPVA